MALKYKMSPNSLTTPQSFSATAAPHILDKEALINDILGTNPGMQKGQIRLFLDVFADRVQANLEMGNGITIEKFLRFGMSIRGNFANEADTPQAENIEVNAVLSVSFVNDVRQHISLEREATTRPTPVITSHTNGTRYKNLLFTTETLNGNNLQSNESRLDEGIFITNKQSLVTKRVSMFSKNMPAEQIFVDPKFDTPTQQSFNEYSIEIRTRFTENGSLRIGLLNNPVRTPLDLVYADLASSPENEVLFISSLPTIANNLENITASLDGFFSFYIKMTPQKGGVLEVGDQVLFTVAPTFFHTGETPDPADVIETVVTIGATNTVPILAHITDEARILSEITIVFDDLAATGTKINQEYGGELYEYIQYQAEEST